MLRDPHSILFLLSPKIQRTANVFIPPVHDKWVGGGVGWSGGEGEGVWVWVCGGVRVQVCGGVGVGVGVRVWDARDCTDW